MGTKPRSISLKGIDLYVPDDAPTGQWISTYWADNCIAIGFLTDDGKWWRGLGGESTMVRTDVRVVGWRPVC